MGNKFQERKASATDGAGMEVSMMRKFKICN
jgi:hypothetical protein